ncbi:siderophore ABC transporter substrate-binding protein [Psychromarinibacter sp. S121]|uniref:siderophore ABC transporter substrate-binding protein n=1 Tax=Psychromarinibacter sp. S121 TaxID=3415127 RepID=UPI003C79E4B1
MFRTFSATVAAAALLALPAMADPVTIETATGPAEIETTPETVAVFDMAALDTLDALGVPVTASISNIMVDYLKQYEGDIGTLFEPDFEALYALGPDLVIAGGRSAAQVTELQKYATTIDMTTMGGDQYATTLARLDAYGKLFGMEDKAAELADALNAQLEATKAAAEGAGNALLVLTNGPKISAYGAGSRFGWVHGALDLPETVEGLEVATHGEAISFEFIAEANPDWLLVIDRVAAIGAEGDSAEATLDNALVAETNAWKDGHVVYLNASDIYVAGGGYTSTMNTLKLLEQAFGGADS